MVLPSLCQPFHRSESRRAPQRRGGFSLIELLVVIAIVALLISIILPSLAAARESARRSVCASNLRQTALMMMLYANDQKERLPRMNRSTTVSASGTLTSVTYTELYWVSESMAEVMTRDYGLPSNPRADGLIEYPFLRCPVARPLDATVDQSLSWQTYVPALPGAAVKSDYPFYAGMTEPARGAENPGRPARVIPPLYRALAGKREPALLDAFRGRPDMTLASDTTLFIARSLGDAGASNHARGEARSFEGPFSERVSLIRGGNRASVDGSVEASVPARMGWNDGAMQPTLEGSRGSSIPSLPNPLFFFW